MPARPPPAAGAPSPGSLRALLGPTNTGKTHRAIERLLEHPTGMIGLPLRLLAREVYDRVTARVGESAVALITGEEKRVPAHPRYWICTVEAMPLELLVQDPQRVPGPPRWDSGGEAASVPTRSVDFLAVDEVQLATHRQRGHVFTDRMLHARGTSETWFLGSATIGPLLGRLCPGAVIEGRPRLSTLSDAGSLALNALPARLVVVAFSATRVYELAERLRRKRGGAGVVIGALSPRARNAQVALFQSGEVDTLVATDAIGMGLNLDVDQVVFADLRKFDGRQARLLEDAELAQIAGRAGRHMRDGRFATLEPLPPLPPPTVRALERHRFPPDQQVFWRNSDLDLTSVDGLLASLKQRPRQPWLRLADDAPDQLSAAALARMDEVRALATGPERLRLYWQVCQIPDFRQLPFDDHFKLQAAIFRQLCTGGRLTPDWVDAQLRRLERTEGDLETLLDRMSAVRTWTYVTAKREWIDEAAAWQTRTHALEDRLSDALHQQLVQRFVDAPGHRRRRAGTTPADRAVAPGLRSLAGELAAKVPGALGVEPATPEPEADAWVEALIDAPHEAFAVDGQGRLSTAGRALGRLVRGSDRLHPEVNLTAPMGAGARLRLGRRLLAFARDLVTDLLQPLQLADAEHLGPEARGVLYQLRQSLGSVATAGVGDQLGAIPPAQRRRLKDAGLVLGPLALYHPALLVPAALDQRRALCAAERWPDPLPVAADASALTLPAQPGVPARIYEALGYVLQGRHALRADQRPGPRGGTGARNSRRRG